PVLLSRAARNPCAIERRVAVADAFARFVRAGQVATVAAIYAESRAALRHSHLAFAMGLQPDVQRSRCVPDGQEQRRTTCRLRLQSDADICGPWRLWFVLRETVRGSVQHLSAEPGVYELVSGALSWRQRRSRAEQRPVPDASAARERTGAE